jgi:hypothetical protein
MNSIIWIITSDILLAFSLILIILGLIGTMFYIKYHYDMQRTPLDAKKDLDKLLSRAYFRHGALGSTIETDRVIEEVSYNEVISYIDEMKRLINATFGKE